MTEQTEEDRKAMELFPDIPKRTAAQAEGQPVSENGMSSCNCEKCGTILTDTEFGYVTGCEHHPADSGAAHRYLLKQLCLLDNSLPFLARVAAEHGHFTAEPLKRWSGDLKTTIGIMLGGK